MVADVRRRDDLTKLVDLALERHGRLDVLVANAGIGPTSPIEMVVRASRPKGRSGRGASGRPR